jgi:hypothetical protein
MCGMLTAVSQPASKITLAVDIPHQLPARQDWPGGRAQAKQQHTPSVCSACADPLASPTPAGPAPQAPDTPVHPSRQPEPAGAGHAPQQHMPHMLSHGRSPDAAAEVPAGLEAAQQPAYNAPKCVPRISARQQPSCSTRMQHKQLRACVSASSPPVLLPLVTRRHALLPCGAALPAARQTPYRLRISVADFDILQRLGDGSFSTVMLARYKGNGQQYAVKIVNKTLVLRNKVCACVCERRQLSSVRVWQGATPRGAPAGDVPPRQQAQARHLRPSHTRTRALSHGPAVCLPCLIVACDVPRNRWRSTFGTSATCWTSCTTQASRSCTSHSRCERARACVRVVALPASSWPQLWRRCLPAPRRCRRPFHSQQRLASVPCTRVQASTCSACGQPSTRSTSLCPAHHGVTAVAASGVASLAPGCRTTTRSTWASSTAQTGSCTSRCRSAGRCRCATRCSTQQRLSTRCRTSGGGAARAASHARRRRTQKRSHAADSGPQHAL